MTVHPKGIGAHVLLTSVFGPYAQDDEFGSRRVNPMELYHLDYARSATARRNDAVRLVSYFALFY